MHEYITSRALTLLLKFYDMKICASQNIFNDIMKRIIMCYQYYLTIYSKK